MIIADIGMAMGSVAVSVISVAILAAAGKNTAVGYHNLFIFLTLLSVAALILSFFLSNKTIGKVD